MLITDENGTNTRTYSNETELVAALRLELTRLTVFFSKYFPEYAGLQNPISALEGMKKRWKLRTGTVRGWNIEIIEEDDD